VPISPLGEPAHYEALREKLRSCDLVVTAAWVQLAGDSQAAGPGVEPAVVADRPRPAHDAGCTTGRLGRRRPPVHHRPRGANDCRCVAGRPAGPHTHLARPPGAPPPTQGEIVSRYVTRVLVGQVLAAHARQALEPNRSGPGPLDAYCRYCAEQLSEVVRQLHTERQGETLRVAVVDLVGVLPGGGLGYSPGEVDWMTVFPWLPGDSPSEARRPWIERVFDELHRAPVGVVAGAPNCRSRAASFCPDGPTGEGCAVRAIGVRDGEADA
jgi:hypothetical protein